MQDVDENQKVFGAVRQLVGSGWAIDQWVQSDSVKVLERGLVTMEKRSALNGMTFLDR